MVTATEGVSVVLLLDSDFMAVPFWCGFTTHISVGSLKVPSVLVCESADEVCPPRQPRGEREGFCDLLGMLVEQTGPVGVGP